MRVAFDITPAMAEEVERIIAATDLKNAPEVLRRAFTLLRIHVDAARDGCEMIRQQPGSEVRDLIVLPFEVKATRPANGGEG